MYLFSASLKPRRTTCGRARSSRRNRFELGDRRDRRVTVSLTIRHGSPRGARHRSSHAGIESRTRPDRFQLPAWLDSTPADGRCDPWRPAIVAISAFQHEVSVANRGDASRRGAFRLVALVVFEVFASFVVNALIKASQFPGAAMPFGSWSSVRRWALGLERAIGGDESDAFRACRRSCRP